MEDITVTGAISSLRSCVKSEVFERLLASFSLFDDVLGVIYKLGGDHRISNSEALLLAAMYGSHEVGVRTKFLRLNDHFPLFDSRPNDPDALNGVLDKTNGLLLSSPVYFGDRSSLIADLIRFFRDSGGDSRFPLDGKAVGTLSVGAKRNGGQETTNVYALYDCLDLGACVVGNGPPTSQHGGTGWAGNIGAIIDDNFGLSTSKGTGRRVGLLCKVLNLANTSVPVRVLFLVTRSDREGRFIEKIKNLPFSGDVETDILDLSDVSIKRCLACPICPGGALDKEYTCIIPRESAKGEKDDMRLIHSHLIKADCIVLAHYSCADAGPDRFQTFMERTRFIRRNNFELADRMFSIFMETDSLTDIYPLRFMTSFLRHNLFIVGPFYRALQKPGEKSVHENIPSQAFAKRIEAVTRKSRYARDISLNRFGSTYEPVGYVGI
jgi:multimeric flavodoxin WrbA